MKSFWSTEKVGAGVVVLLAGSLLFSGCRFFEDPNVVIVEEGTSVQRLAAGPGEGGPHAEGEELFLSFDLLAVEEDGRAVSCTEEGVDVAVEFSSQGPDEGFLEVEEIRAVCGSHRAVDIAIAVDNSGSLDGFVGDAREAARVLAADIIAGGGRVAIVRISTVSRAVTGLTDDMEEVDAALDDLFVNRGWTALYDGIRIGNEVLGRELGTTEVETYESLEAFCDAQRPFAVVAITDGNDNNSSDQNLASAEGDGIDTSLEDLFDLNVNGIQTPVYTVAVGVDVDHDVLRELAEATGGRHLEAHGPNAAALSFEAIAGYPAATHRVCARVVDSSSDQSGNRRKGCGVSWARVYYGNNRATATVESRAVNVPCPHSPAAGRSVAMMLKLSHPSIGRAEAARLASNAVSWVSPVATPGVLVVRDNTHNQAYGDDPLVIAQMLEESGFAVTFMEEPGGGITSGILKDYDVVWFSNPDLPMANKGSLLSLLKFAGDGGGVILSGDDMTNSRFSAFPMTSLLHAEHVSNGAYSCGVRTHRDDGESYEVEFEAGHPVLEGLENLSFEYGYNIDHSIPLERGEEVLAWARFDDGQGCLVETPAMIAFSAP